jgi:hypothetical protein
MDMTREKRLAYSQPSPDNVGKPSAVQKARRLMHWLPATPHGKLMLTILGGLAEFERTLIRTRTEDGRIRAKAAGIRFGRKP